MTDDFKIGDALEFLGILLIVCLFIFGAVNYVMCIINEQDIYKVIRGEVTNVDIVYDDDNTIHYLEVTVENETNIETVNVFTKYDMDLTVNSEIILELHETKYSENFWWNEAKGDNIWYITELIRVPGETT